jgi:hypothetical protein
MLPQFYLDYLKTYLPDSELLTLQILVWLLQVHRQVGDPIVTEQETTLDV